MTMARRILAAFVLALIFMRELWLSSVSVARAAFARDLELSPAIVAVPVELDTQMGVATVANLISLTPGTTSLHTSADGRVIFVHCLDTETDYEVIVGVRDNFTRWVARVEGRA